MDQQQSHSILLKGDQLLAEVESGEKHLRDFEDWWYSTPDSGWWCEREGVPDQQSDLGWGIMLAVWDYQYCRTNTHAGIPLPEDFFEKPCEPWVTSSLREEFDRYLGEDV